MPGGMPAGGRGGGALPLSDTRLPWTWTSGAEGVGDGGGIADMAIHCYENGADLLRRTKGLHIMTKENSVFMGLQRDT